MRQVRHVPGQLLAALQEQRHFRRFLSDANPQALANTACACGQLGYRSSILLEGIMQQAARLQQRHRSNFVTQEFCNLCWAVAVLDMQQYVPAVLQLTQACSGMWDTVETEGLQQLHQVHIWLQQLQSSERPQGLSGVLSKQQLMECAAAWEQQCCSNAAAATSQLQRQVFAALQQLPSTMWQGELRMEAVTPDGNFNIDIAAVTAAGVQLAVEVDGPTHFVSPGRRVDGPTQFRNRMLAAQGYTVISIPYCEWNACKTAQQRHDYLMFRLQGETGCCQGNLRCVHAQRMHVSMRGGLWRNSTQEEECTDHSCMHTYMHACMLQPLTHTCRSLTSVSLTSASVTRTVAVPTVGPEDCWCLCRAQMC
jgi:very-short-patch-repair endonuclease